MSGGKVAHLRAAPGALARVREARELLFAEAPPGAPFKAASPGDVRRLVLIDSAPRSGSSLLYDLLRRLPGVCAPRGELVPFLKLHGLAPCMEPHFMRYADIAEAGVPRALGRDVLADLSLGGAEAPSRGDALFGGNPSHADDFVREAALRFTLQWPRVEVSPEEIREAALTVLAGLRRAGRRHHGFAREAFMLELLALLRKARRALNPYYCDIPAPAVRERFPRLSVPEGPPDGEIALEEPPFVLPEPSRRPSPRELAEGTLLVKSVGLCYTPGLLERLFPRAEVRVVHLVRNPAAAVNGLIDGWLHRGFFSTNLEPYFRSGRARVRKLDIAGYSDTHPWGRRWWNFELPPDWESVARAPLGEVCAHQWRAANAAILEYLEERSLPHVRLRFEDFIESPGEHLEKLVDFMGLPPGSLRCWDGRLPVVQATESPRPHRWRARRHALLPFVQSPLTEGLARRLGYDPALLDDWR